VKAYLKSKCHRLNLHAGTGNVKGSIKLELGQQM